MCIWFIAYNMYEFFELLHIRGRRSLQYYIGIRLIGSWDKGC